MSMNQSQIVDLMEMIRALSLKSKRNEGGFIQMNKSDNGGKREDDPDGFLELLVRLDKEEKDKIQNDPEKNLEIRSKSAEQMEKYFSIAHFHVAYTTPDGNGGLVGCQHPGKTDIKSYDLLKSTGAPIPNATIFHKIAKTAFRIDWTWKDRDDIKDQTLEVFLLPTGKFKFYVPDINISKARTDDVLSVKESCTKKAEPNRGFILKKVEESGKESIWCYPTSMSKNEQMMLALKVSYIQDGKNYSELIVFENLSYYVDKPICECEKTRGGDRKRKFKDKDKEVSKIPKNQETPLYSKEIESIQRVTLATYKITYSLWGVSREEINRTLEAMGVKDSKFYETIGIGIIVCKIPSDQVENVKNYFVEIWRSYGGDNPTIELDFLADFDM